MEQKFIVKKEFVMAENKSCEQFCAEKFWTAVVNMSFEKNIVNKFVNNSSE